MKFLATFVFFPARLLRDSHKITVKHIFRKITNMTTTAPYGSWKSPISSKLVSESSVAFQEVHIDAHPDSADTVYWSELRYDEGGRYVICSHKQGTEGFISWTPEGFNARTRVHEYGGGAFMVYNGRVYFSNFSDQDMYTQGLAGEAPKRVTPKNTHWRYADGQFNAKTGRIYCVREDHSKVESGEAKEPQNTIVTISPVDGKQNVLAEGCDFYSCPRVSPDGKKIAWVQWNHPNMPWDSTALIVAELSDGGCSIVKGSEKQVAGGKDISVIQPSWSCDNELLYVDDRTDWWNLYHVTKSGDHVNILPRNQECGGPQWIFGMSSYMVDPRGNGDVITVYKNEMGIYNLNTKSYKALETGFSSHSFVNIGRNGMIYCVAGSPTKFSSVVQVDPQSGKVKILRESKSLVMDTGYFSIPTEIQWKTTEGDDSYGYFYPPINKDFKGPEGTLPPLLVKNHGGPTSQTSNVLNLKTQYFTSRGMAVLDVNYRGSTGYGKKYRHKLRYKWGVYDLDDACTGARHLADTGKVDGEKLCIDGGSAGGYTTLAALTFRDVFKAGASHYGICDIEALIKDTQSSHKFESKYDQTLIAPYDEEHMHVFRERSPIHYLDQMSGALAIFQGDEDKVPVTMASVTLKPLFGIHTNLKLGASHYGVGDLEALAKDTHKFESRYLDTMISPYDESHKKVYIERSPIHHTDGLSCALVLFQGDEDKIVPPNQAEMMYKAVKAKGLPTAYVLFKGEQHGFRKAENIQKALDGEFYFFSKVFGYEAADKNIDLPIDNLK